MDKATFFEYENVFFDQLLKKYITDKILHFKTVLITNI